MNNRPEPKFVPGERVLIVDSKKFPEKVGSETEILGVHWVSAWKDGLPADWGYKTAENNHIEKCSWSGDQLRKLPPETPATFDAAIWAPSGVSA